MIDGFPRRDAREALRLTRQVVALGEAAAPRCALVAAVDQVHASLTRERHRTVFRTLSWVCRTVLDPTFVVEDDGIVVETALQVVARTLDVAEYGDRSPGAARDGSRGEGRP